LGNVVPEISLVLRNMYMRRIQRVAHVAQQGHNVEALEFVQGLDKAEQRMLKLCQQEQSAAAEWQQNKAYTLKKASAISL
ncbi:hypothetical protein IW140_006467, partial [Coemansia sp. RSA 1813]